MTETPVTIVREREYIRGWRLYLNGQQEPLGPADRVCGWQEAKHAAEVCKREIGWSKP